MAQQLNNGMQKFEVTIWEKAEHWTFDINVEAKNEDDMIKKVVKDYPRKSYTIRRWV